ncbi:hypothetical protein ACQR1H_20045 [Bradyrhizobium sp. HKCCYLRH2015]|uniref:P-loop NTPase n=1 Tax=unclassified Bradyrhizobium TaxID=2631580 RepID=UPI003EBA9C36
MIPTLAEKYRLDYLRKTYFPDLSNDSEFRRRVVTVGIEEQSDPDYEKPATLTLLTKKEAGIPLGPRVSLKHNPFLARIKLPGDSNYSDTQSIGDDLRQACAHVFATDIFLRQGKKITVPKIDRTSVKPSAAEKIKAEAEEPFFKLRDQIFDYLQNGSRYPYQLLGEQALGHELTYEPLLKYNLTRERERTRAEGKKLGLVIRTEGALFLRGAEPRDWSILSDVAVPRIEHEEAIARSIVENRLCIVTGAAGDGKTTICKRVALRLKSAGWRVFYATAPDDTSQDLSGYKLTGSNTAVFVDNAEFLNSFTSVSKFLRANPHVSLVLIARHHQIIDKLKPISHLNPREHFVGRCKAELAESLAKTIVRHGAAPDCSEAILIDRIRTSISEGSTHLLAIMIYATRGESFSTTIQSMIRQFSASGDDWILRLVALGAMFAYLANNPQLLVDRTLITKFADIHCDGNEAESTRSILERTQSEIMRRSSSSSSTKRATLSLRHPDIVTEVLRRFYEINPGVDIGDVETFESDLRQLCLAATMVAMEKAYSYARRVPNYSITLLSFLLSYTCEHSWIPRAPVIDTAFYCAKRWGTSEADKAQAIRYIFHVFKNQLNNKIDDVEDIRHTGMRYVAMGGDDPNLLTLWMTFEFDNANPGAVETKYSGRWIGYEHLLKANFPDPNLLACWLTAEFNLGNAGSPSKIHSGRWLGSKHLSQSDPPDANLLACWLKAEFDLGNAGSSTEPYTGRWLAHKHLSYPGIPDSSLIATWMKAEVSLTKCGDQNESGYLLARSVAETAWMRGVRGADFIQKWIQLEAGQRNFGSKTTPVSVYGIVWRYCEEGYLDNKVIDTLLRPPIYQASPEYYEIETAIRNQVGEINFEQLRNKITSGALCTNEYLNDEKKA